MRCTTGRMSVLPDVGSADIEYVGGNIGSAGLIEDSRAADADDLQAVTKWGS